MRKLRVQSRDPYTPTSKIRSWPHHRNIRSCTGICSFDSNSNSIDAGDHRAIRLNLVGEWSAIMSPYVLHQGRSDRYGTAGRSDFLQGPCEAVANGRLRAA